ATPEPSAPRPPAAGGASPAPGVPVARTSSASTRLPPRPGEPLWKKFVEKFDEPIIKILLAAALLSMFVELFRGNPEATPRIPGNPAVAGIALAVVLIAGIAHSVLKMGQSIPTLMFGSAVIVFFLGLIVPPHHPSIEGLAVMIAVMLATGVAFASEYKSDREFEILNAQKEALRVKVVRSGEFHTIPMDEVVVG